MFFPLDQELELTSAGLTPALLELVVWLGTIEAFTQTPISLRRLLGVTLDHETARRWTEAAGRALLEVEAAATASALVELSQPRPDASPDERTMQVSVDGATVRVTTGESRWAEVKTMAIGEVEARPAEAATGKTGREWTPRTTELSYYSRSEPSEAFELSVTGELARRGVFAAKRVAAINDGAPWIQGLVDHHCPEAIRILDFPHAAQQIARAGQARFGVGTTTQQAWLKTQLTTLKSGDPDQVIAAIQRLGEESEVEGSDQAVIEGVVNYLQTRRDQVAYAQFRSQGLPIGSGAVESANKRVVEARLKGPGMHWQRTNISPMVALRAMKCSQRWQTQWPAISEQLQAELQQRQAEGRQRRRAAKAAQAQVTPADETRVDPLAATTTTSLSQASELGAPVAPSMPVPSGAGSAAVGETARAEPTLTSVRPRAKRVIDGRPTAGHVWRRFHLPGSRPPHPPSAKS